MNKEYSRTFGNFRGIDATSELSQVADARFAYAENMYKDYESGQGMSVETFPGHRLLTRFKDASIYGLYMYKSINDSRKYIVVHAGKCLYRFPHDERDELKDLTPIPDIMMEENHSTGFLFNNRLYILDGKNYVCIDEDGNAENVDEDNAYVPTTYSNGLEYEQRNMLTNKFKERYFATTSSLDVDDDWIFHNTDGIITGIRVTQEDEGETETRSIRSSILVPPGLKKVKIDFSVAFHFWVLVKDAFGYPNSPPKLNKDYKSFKDDLYGVYMTNSVTDIEGSFDGCKNLEKLYLSNNITKLSDRFFAGTALETIYLPKKLLTLGTNAFEGCDKLKTIYAPEGFDYEFPAGVAVERYGDRQILFHEHPFLDVGEDFCYWNKQVTATFDECYIKERNSYAVYSPCVEISKITFDGEDVLLYDDAIDELPKKDEEKEAFFYIPKYNEIDGEYYITHILFGRIIAKSSSISIVDPSAGGELIIEGVAKDGKFVSATKKLIATENKEDFDDTDKSVKGSNPDYKGTSKEAINNCNVTTVFDDRIFFTGNENLPNTVFYTQRDQTGHTNPTYVGILNYFNDGVGNVRNSAMMASATMLMVLKGDTAQDGSIFYHTAQSADNDITPRIYPSVEGVPGLGCTGVAVNFRDDCVFLSKRGLEAVAKQTVNLERTVQHRSTNIDALFKGKDLTKARAAEWCGYLLILIDGELYLADSRQMFEGIGGAIEYEWYYCKDIGDYTGDNERYYTDTYGEDKDLPEGIEKYADRVAVDYTTVNSDLSTGKEIFYALIDGKPYLVSKSEELEGGILNVATEILCVDDVLYFGTTSGGILCLNSDTRDNFGRIPENTYNRCGHAYASVLQFKLDDAGVPYYTKNTVKRSPTFNLKPFINSSVTISVATDRDERTPIAEQSNNILDFDAFDFSNTATQQSQRSIFVIKERTKKWVEKQYDISSEKHNAPFGIYSLAYRYEIAGRIKK